MKTVVPDYYPDFRCKAGKCQNTCCAGWEIDIDEETYEAYKRIGGKLGKKLMDAISTEDTVHFILEGTDERCPMLDKNGLCVLITEFGEEALCQICADHPRFWNDYSDRTEIGLGLCCEAAGELILGKKDKVRFITLSDDGNNEPVSHEESRLLKLRSNIIDILQNRRRPVGERMKLFLNACGTKDKRSLKHLADLFLSLERLDEKWTGLLLSLKDSDSADRTGFDKAEQTMLEQFAVYLVFRYTPYLESENAVLSISGMYRIFEALCRQEKSKDGKIGLSSAAEAARLLSSEAEYSDNNVEILFR